MAFTREELKEKLVATYLENGMKGDLVNMVSDILSSYLFIHQMEDVSILMEDSFLRSRLLDSRIQHAADNFYSVFRGSNRKIRIKNLRRIKPGRVSRFDIISTYGQYKLVYAEDMIFSDADVSADKLFDISAYLITGDPVTRTYPGNGKLYLDIIDDEDNPVRNISENISVTSIDDRGTDDTGDDEKYDFRMSSDITDILTSDSARSADMAVMTMPGYGVRLWKVDGFPDSYSYVVRYLPAPDSTVTQWSEEELKKNIRSVPGFTKTELTDVLTESAVSYRLDDPDKIYLYASSNVRFSGMMKSVASIENMVREFFPEFLGFNIIVGPHTAPTVPSGDIEIYFCTETGSETSSGSVDPEKVERFNSLLSSYYINSNVRFKSAGVRSIQGTFYYTVHYNSDIDYSGVEQIINDQKAIVGNKFNPYRVIADIMGDPSFAGRIGWIDLVYVRNDVVSPVIIYDTIKPNERVEYKFEMKFEPIIK